MEPHRLPVDVILFFRSRAWCLSVSSAALIELSLPLWGHRAMIVKHGNFYEEMPLAVPAQFIVVVLLLYSANSPLREFERLAARRLWPARMVAIFAGIVAVGGCALISSAVIGDSGTLGWAAPAIAGMGMYGIGLAASTIVDRRIAGLFGLLPVVAPITLDPTGVPGHQIWNFVTAEESGLGAGAAVVWLVVGLVLHITVERFDHVPFSNRDHT